MVGMFVRPLDATRTKQMKPECPIPIDMLINPTVNAVIGIITPNHQANVSRQLFQ
jgi:hypothetical protein